MPEDPIQSANPDRIAPVNTCCECRPTWRQRLAWRLFPRQHMDWPQFEGAKDGVLSRTVVYLSFTDCLRLLISRRFTVETKIRTENFLGSHRAAAQFLPDPPKFLSGES